MSMILRGSLSEDAGAEMGTRVPRLLQCIGSGGGTGVSIPWGASGGTEDKWGNRSRMRSRTGRVKSMKASSMDALSGAVSRSIERNTI